MKLLGIPSLAIVCLLFTCSGLLGASSLDEVLNEENVRLGAARPPAPPVDDLTYLRRVSVDLIGRIPTLDEINEYQAWPSAERRSRLVEKLLKHDRFADRWTVFFADLLRLRSNVEGGSALIAFVHQSIAADVPYDELVRRLVTTNGKANRDPEVGFLLGDAADPMALARSTSQVFMGVRMGCAQCHNHPFDVWTRKDFYGLAAFYGKTRRVNSQLTRVVYTTEADQTTVLWPPEGEEEEDTPRKPMTPRFPIQLKAPLKPEILARLEKVRRQRASASKSGAPNKVEELLAGVDEQVRRRVSESPLDDLNVKGDAASDLEKIDIRGSLYRRSQLREQLAEFLTSPRNIYFSQSFVNRVWAELVGRGFVEPVDDFRQDNPPSHPETLRYLADEFVASGYDLKSLVRMVVRSEAYQRAHVDGSDSERQQDMESSFLATPMRRVLSESLYDSIVAAGHLFDVKHRPGQNKKTAFDTVRVLKDSKDEGSATRDPAGKGVAELLAGGGGAAMAAKPGPRTGYELETAIELDFGAILKAGKQEVKLDRMQVMSKEELEAMRMQQQARMRRGEYETKTVKRVYDDNPRFSSSLRMASPAPAGHFLRVFGQTNRADLGDFRDPSPSMRQALMMLNGRLTHEASRVGELEPIHALLVGSSANLDKAVRLAYLEILTRKPTAAELADAKQIVESSESVLEGVADLRWVLLNCNEFRYLP